jgi:hypothetical protein
MPFFKGIGYYRARADRLRGREVQTIRHLAVVSVFAVVETIDPVFRDDRIYAGERFGNLATLQRCRHSVQGILSDRYRTGAPASIARLRRSTSTLPKTQLRLVLVLYRKPDFVSIRRLSAESAIVHEPVRCVRGGGRRGSCAAAGAYCRCFEEE